MTEATSKLKRAQVPPPPVPLMIAGIVLPGLGHVLQKRYGHAAIFAIAVLGLFGLGETISNASAIDPHNHPIYYLLQLLGGGPAWAMHFGGLENEALIGVNVGVRMQALGTSFCAIAGVLNLLAVLELAKHAPGRRLLDASGSASAGEGA